MCQAIEAAKRTIDEDHEKQQMEDCAIGEAIFEGATRMSYPFDAARGHATIHSIKSGRTPKLSILCSRCVHHTLQRALL